MGLATDEAAVLARIEQLASGTDLIRLVVLTSGRARPDDPVDLLSDYDIVLLVHDPEVFSATDVWVRGFGVPLIIVRDSESRDGIESQHCMVLYEDGTKIDYTVSPQMVIDGTLLTDLRTNHRA